MFSQTTYLASIVIATLCTHTLAQSPSSFPAHCLPRIDSDPSLDPQSCAIALNEFDSENGNLSNFTQNPSQPGTVQLPWDRTYNDCRLRVEMLYANEAEQSVHDVWAQGMTLLSNCVSHSNYVGGRIFVNPAGLTLSLRPVGNDNGWEERFNTSSVVMGQSTSEEGATGAGLTQVTAGSSGSA